ncbi:alpha-L-fucosidase [Paenibacillus terrigena]|uniref:alpha-L-fucosidase n=1 Tax=Paenibacillus terrigena TaxID=369333 RepID=UPI00035F6128|nr:alpha-L-fucosidase [Paenibacillus terrigena]
MVIQSSILKRLAWVTAVSFTLSLLNMYAFNSQAAAAEVTVNTAKVQAQALAAEAPVKIVQAHQWSDKSGSVQIVQGTAPDGNAIGNIASGDWVKYAGVDFGTGSYDTFMATIAASSSEAGRKVEIRLDSQSGMLIGTLTVNSTGNVALFKEQYASIANVTGVHDVYLTFPDGSIGSMNWFALGQTPDHETKEQRDQRMQWFNDARFGQFIHWGAYTQLAGTYNGKTVNGAAEWIMNYLNIPKDDYIQQAAAPFNPTQYDPKAWVDVMKQAGQKYMVITSKHHDGFSMFDTGVNGFKDYNIVKTSAYGKDPMAELSKEAKKQGIKFGFYYSILEWVNPKVPAQKELYVSEMKEQLRELIEKYDPDLLWFDGEWDAWWTKQDGKELYRYLRTLKNDLIINNRVGKRESDDGDYGTPEQEIPATGLPYIWETCMTMNGSWGFHAKDLNWKSTKTLISNLVEASSKGGNYLLNVGPTPEGLIPQASVDRLTEMGNWLKLYGESIYDSKASIFASKFPWGYSTTKNGKVYLHVLNQPENNQIVLPRLLNKVNKVYSLADDKVTLNYTLGEEITINLPASLPNSYDSVYVIDVDGVPKIQVFENLALKKPATASNFYKNDANYNASKAVDGDASTRWATDDPTNAAWLEVNFGENTTFNKVVIDEWIYNNMLRIAGFAIQYWDGTTWKDAYQGSTAGPYKTITFDPVTGSKVRLNITSVTGTAGPTINEFQVYNTGVKANGITLDQQQLKLKIGQSGQLTATVMPANASNKTVLWSSSDDSVASLEDLGDGRVTIRGVKAGTAEITAMAVDGGFKATSIVNVEDANTDEAAAALTAPNSVKSGQSFTVQIDMNQVKNKVYGMDISMNYDANLMEYVSAKSIHPGISIVASTNPQAGKIRFIVASEGADKGISGNTPLLTLDFKAKDVQGTKSGTISITNATLGDEMGTESTAAQASLRIEVTSTSSVGSGDLNHDGRISIGDLAILASYYGKTSSDPEWDKVKDADFDGNQVIDFVDLAALAQKIIIT